jgi:hypothetical protein
MAGSGPLGIRPPSQKSEILLDWEAMRGRWQATQDGKVRGIYQQTPSGVSFWTEKMGTQKLRDAEMPFAYVPLMKTGLVGLLALRNTSDTITYVEKGEIKGKKGQMIVRSQPTPKETLVSKGRDGFAREICQTTWAYLFAPDGTLIAERVTQKQGKSTVQTEMSFDRFEVVDGIKFPTEVSVKSSQIPRGFSLKLKIKKITVNAPIPASEFNLPGG